jgi:hypothetical protein
VPPRGAGGGRCSEGWRAVRASGAEIPLRVGDTCNCGADTCGPMGEIGIAIGLKEWTDV